MKSLIFSGFGVLGCTPGSPWGALPTARGALGVLRWNVGRLEAPWGSLWAALGRHRCTLSRIFTCQKRCSTNIRKITKQRLQGTQPSFRVGVGRPRLTFSRVLRDKNVIGKITKQKQQETQPSFLVPLGRPRSTLARVLHVKNVVQQITEKSQNRSHEDRNRDFGRQLQRNQ